MLALGWPVVGVVLGCFNVGLLVWAELTNVREFWPVLVILLVFYGSWEAAEFVSMRAFRRLESSHPDYMSDDDRYKSSFLDRRHVLDAAAVDRTVRDDRYMHLYRVADGVTTAVNFELAVTVAGTLIWVFVS